MLLKRLFLSPADQVDSPVLVDVRARDPKINKGTKKV